MEKDFILIAESISRKAHHNQKRRGGNPYITHPQSVVLMVIDDDYIKATAWLHDVLEDTDVTEKDLLKSGIPVEVVEAVKLLTKLPSQPYEEYLKKIKENKIALCVKICDMLHNLCDSPTFRQKEKYIKGIQFLSQH